MRQNSKDIRGLIVEWIDQTQRPKDYSRKEPPISLNENEWTHLNLLSAASSFIESVIRLAFHINCVRCNLTYWLPTKQKSKSIQLVKVISKDRNGAWFSDVRTGGETLFTPQLNWLY